MSQPATALAFRGVVANIALGNPDLNTSVSHATRGGGGLHY